MNIKTKANSLGRTQAILEGLLEIGQETTDLIMPLVAKFLSNYQNSYRAARQRITGDTYHLEKKSREARQKSEIQYFHTSLQYLKREGFVTNEREGKSSFWILTSEGEAHLNKLKTKHEPYKKEKTATTFVVSYDIPESSRRHRNWIRGVLHFLDFSMIHKSVWIGNSKIPENFLHDLKKKGIFRYVHIFGLGKRGTLAKLQ